jgi:D-alanine-D-alanine ligase
MEAERIYVAFGGPSAEHDISILTGLQCEHLLRQSGKDINAVYWDRAGQWFLVPPMTEASAYLNGAPEGSVRLELRLGPKPGFYRRRTMRDEVLDPGVILNCFHGGFGEGGGVQALFALLGMASTGGSLYSAALGMDKLAFGSVMRDAGVPALSRVALLPDCKPDFAGPYIVKPRFGGSSVGIEIVDDIGTATELLRSSVHLRQGAVVEPYRPDLFDVNIAFRTYPTFETSMIERPSRSTESAIYSYEDKYLQGSGLASAPREIPAQLPDAVSDAVRNLAARVCDLTGLNGIVRVDMLTDGESEIYVNEVNSIPGAMSLYLWPPDVSPLNLLLDAVTEAASLGIETGPSFRQGVALQVAGGIASKLVGLRREPE